MKRPQRIGGCNCLLKTQHSAKMKVDGLFKNPQLIYISEEGESLINEIHLEDMNRQKLDNKKNKKSKIKKANNKKNKGYINNSQNHKRKDGNNGNI